ncbi:MAG: hypothetical protein ACRD2C_13915 [Acidimicrobiales bacterium]
MVFLWVVPAVAAAVGVAIVLSRMRALEDLSVDLLAEVQRTRELHSPLAAVRKEMALSGPIVDRVEEHWSDDAPLQS